MTWAGAKLRLRAGPCSSFNSIKYLQQHQTVQFFTCTILKYSYSRASHIPETASFWWKAPENKKDLIHEKEPVKKHEWVSQVSGGTVWLRGRWLNFRGLNLRHLLNPCQIPREWKPLPWYLCWGMWDEFGVSIQHVWSSHSDHKVTVTSLSNWHSYWWNQQDLMAMETALSLLTLEAYRWGRVFVLSLTILSQPQDKQRDFSFQACQSGIFYKKETH